MLSASFQLNFSQGANVLHAQVGSRTGTGGYSAGYNETLASLEVWDPNTQSWTNGTDMPTPRGDLMCSTLAGQYVAAGGYWDPTNNFVVDAFRTEVQMFNPTTGALCRQSPLLSGFDRQVMWWFAHATSGYQDPKRPCILPAWHTSQCKPA